MDIIGRHDDDDRHHRRRHHRWRDNDFWFSSWGYPWWWNPWMYAQFAAPITGPAIWAPTLQENASMFGNPWMYNRWPTMVGQDAVLATPVAQAAMVPAPTTALAVPFAQHTHPVGPAIAAAIAAPALCPQMGACPPTVQPIGCLRRKKHICSCRVEAVKLRPDGVFLVQDFDLGDDAKKFDIVDIRVGNRSLMFGDPISGRRFRHRHRHHHHHGKSAWLPLIAGIQIDNNHPLTFLVLNKSSKKREFEIEVCGTALSW